MDDVHSMSSECSVQYILEYEQQSWGYGMDVLERKRNDDDNNDNDDNNKTKI